MTHHQLQRGQYILRSAKSSHSSPYSSAENFKAIQAFKFAKPNTRYQRKLNLTLQDGTDSVNIVVDCPDHGSTTFPLNFEGFTSDTMEQELAFVLEEVVDGQVFHPANRYPFKNQCSSWCFAGERALGSCEAGGAIVSHFTLCVVVDATQLHRS